ncbi:MAG: tetratricopeptide repeat protein [Acidobacteriota bacterium]
MRKILIAPAATFAMAALLATPASAGWEEGVAAFRAKNFQAAAAEFQELVDQNPEGYRSHYMLGMSLSRLNRKEEALNHLRQAYDLNPNDLSIKLELGRAYLTARKYQEVSKLLGPIDAGSLPDNARAPFYQMRAEARLKTNQVDQAYADFKKLGQIKPKDAAVQFKLGALALKSDRLDEALSALDRAVRLDPGDVAKKATYANALIKKGRLPGDKAAKKSSYMKAADVAGQVVAKDPSFDNLMLKLSAELGAGLYDEAVATGQQAQAKNSSDWIVPFYIGQAYTSAGKFTQSEAPLNKALELANATNKKKVWTQLGFAYEKQRKFDESIEAYQKGGNAKAAQRVSDNRAISQENAQIEAENEQIRAMEEEAKRLEEELKKLEEGGGE